MSDEKKKCQRKKDKHRNRKSTKVYGDFIRTFTFSSPQLPIVQPGGSLIFPIPVVEPVGVRYVEEENRVGLVVPRGDYLVSWTLNPSKGSSVNLLVNGDEPVTLPPFTYPYARALTTGLLDVQYIVHAPLRRNNLISFVNGGSTLFSLDNIPNTKIGDTSILTHIKIQSA